MSNCRWSLRWNAGRLRFSAVFSFAAVFCALLLSARSTLAQVVAVDADAIARALSSGGPRPLFVEASKIPPALQARRDADGPPAVLFDASIKNRRSKQVAEQLAAQGAGNVAYLIGSPPEWREIAALLPAKIQIEAPVKLAPSDLAVLLADPSAPQIIDLRDAAAFKRGHIPGAMNLQPHEVANAPARTDATRWIVVIDAAEGSAAPLVAERLFSSARPWVAWVEGGYEAWSKRGAAQK